VSRGRATHRDFALLVLLFIATEILYDIFARDWLKQQLAGFVGGIPAALSFLVVAVVIYVRFLKYEELAAPAVKRSSGGGKKGSGSKSSKGKKTGGSQKKEKKRGGSR